MLTVFGIIFACEFFSLLPLKTILSQLWVLLPVLYAAPAVTGKEVLTYRHRFMSRVWPDIDLFLHKNNVKYLERCETGRFGLLQKTGIATYLQRNNIHLGYSGISIRWRRELRLLQSFTVNQKFLVGMIVLFM